MAEYIEREAAYPLAKKICDAIDSEDFQRLNFGMRILDWIDDLPAADVRPVVRGKWVEMFDSDGYPARNYWLCCSICGHVAPFGRMSDTESHTNYCPNCGAEMRREIK